VNLRGAVVKGLLWSLVLVTGPLVANGWGQASFPPAPTVGTFVIDEAGLIAPTHRPQIDRIATALSAERGYPISVVTIRSLGARGAAGYTIERYASEMVRAWKLDADRGGYGLVLLVAAEDRVARIELGSAWGRGYDTQVRHVMDGLILPAFRRGELSQGILDGVRGFDAMGRGQALPGPERPWWLIPAVAAGALVLVAAIVSLAKSGRRGLAWAAAAFVGAILISRAVAWARGNDADGDGGSTADETGVTGKW